MAQNAEALDGEHEVGLGEVLTDAFVQQHSTFASLQALLDAAGVESNEDLAKPEWDAFVAANTDFPSWEEMQSQGVTEYFERKLFEGLG